MQCHRELREGAKALAACRAGREVYATDADLLFQEALLCRELDDRAGAEVCLLRLLATPEPAHFASIDAGLRGYKARHNLAVIYRELGRDAEAESQWRAALAEQPMFTPAWQGLAELLRDQERWGEREDVLRQFQGLTEAAVRKSPASR